MGWRSFAFALIVIGVALFAVGVYIEYRIQQRVGGGFWSILAHVFHRGEIEHYHGCSAEFVIVGPLLVILGTLLWLALKRRGRVG